MKLRTILFTILLALLLVGCAATGAQPIAMKATSLPNPSANKAIVTGKMINQNDNKPITNKLIRLSRIYGQGKEAIYVYNETSDPGDYTQTDGIFVIKDVIPGPYAIIIIDDNGNYSPIKQNSEKIITIDVSANKILELGEIKVDLPPSSSK